MGKIVVYRPVDDLFSFAPFSARMPAIPVPPFHWFALVAYGDDYYPSKMFVGCMN